MTSDKSISTENRLNALINRNGLITASSTTPINAVWTSQIGSFFRVSA
jgi:hypothetical protein